MEIELSYIKGLDPEKIGDDELSRLREIMIALRKVVNRAEYLRYKKGKKANKNAAKDLYPWARLVKSNEMLDTVDVPPGITSKRYMERLRNSWNCYRGEVIKVYQPIENYIAEFSNYGTQIEIALFDLRRVDLKNDPIRKSKKMIEKVNQMQLKAFKK